MKYFMKIKLYIVKKVDFILIIISILHKLLSSYEIYF